MRPCWSRAMWRSLTKVMVDPSAAYLVASVSSVAVNGELGMGGMTMLSSTSRTPPSWVGCAGWDGSDCWICAMQVRLVSKRIPATDVRISGASRWSDAMSRRRGASMAEKMGVVVRLTFPAFIAKVAKENLAKFAKTGIEGSEMRYERLVDETRALPGETGIAV